MLALLLHFDKPLFAQTVEVNARGGRGHVRQHGKFGGRAGAAVH